MSDTNGRTHTYHAEATILDGFLRLPIERQLKPLGMVSLAEEGGYRTERVEDFHLEGVFRTVRPIRRWREITM